MSLELRVEEQENGLYAIVYGDTEYPVTWAKQIPTEAEAERMKAEYEKKVEIVEYVEERAEKLAEEITIKFNMGIAEARKLIMSAMKD